MPKPNIRCKLCEEIGPAANTHVIPRAFYKLSKGTHDHLKNLALLPVRQKGQVELQEEKNQCSET